MKLMAILEIYIHNVRYIHNITSNMYILMKKHKFKVGLIFCMVFFLKFNFLVNSVQGFHFLETHVHYLFLLITRMNVIF